MAPHIRGTPGGGLTRWPWRRRRSGSILALAALPLALFLALPATSAVAQAASTASAATSASTCLLGLIGCAAADPSPQPTPSAQATASSCLLGLVGCGTTAPTSGLCVLGILLCGGNVISQPTPCVNGQVLCGPPPASPCVAGAVLCEGTIVGPGNPPAGGGGGKAKAPGNGVTAQGLDSSNVAVALGVPPGVGLIPPITQSGVARTPNPDGFSELLSLSIRDGLLPGGSQLWPALAMLQAVLLLVIVGAFAARRVLEASKLPKS